MADLFVHSGQPQNSFQGQNQSSSSDVTSSTHLPPNREQRRQETTSSYTSMGTTPDFETLLNEQAESRCGSSNGNPTGSGGMWSLGGFDSQQSPIGGHGHRFELTGYQHQQHVANQPQPIANPKASSFASSQTYGVPLSAPVHGRRSPGAGTLPRDRRRSSEHVEGVSLGQSAHLSSNTVSRREALALRI
jgi:hypothetical protein